VEITDERVVVDGDNIVIEGTVIDAVDGIDDDETKVVVVVLAAVVEEEVKVKADADAEEVKMVVGAVVKEIVVD